MARDARVEKNTYAGRARQYGPYELELLWAEVLGADRHTGHICAGTRQALHKAGSNRVRRRCDDYRDATGKALEGLRPRRGMAHDEGDIRLQQIGSELWKTLVPAFGVSPLRDQVLAFDISE